MNLYRGSILKELQLAEDLLNDTNISEDIITKTSMENFLRGIEEQIIMN